MTQRTQISTLQCLSASSASSAVNVFLPSSTQLVETEPLAHDIQRTPLHFLVHAAHVITQDADADQLHAADEQDADDDRREAGDRLAHREERHEVEEAERQGADRDEEAKVGRGA